MTRMKIFKRMFLQSMNFLVVFFLASLFVQGAYLVNVPQTLRQPDGTILHCLASGDEFYNWLHDLAGYTIMADPKTGFYVYALKTAAGDLVASPYIAGRVDPTLLGLEKWVKKSPQLLKARLASLEDRRSYQVPAPKTGTISNVVIFIRFSDESEFPNTISGYETNFNASTTGTSSLYNYFREASYNVLSVNTAFYPDRSGSTVVSYQDANPRNYFRPYNASTNPTGYSGDTQLRDREHTLLKNAVNNCSAQILADGLNLDGDGDGRVDNTCFIVSGTADGWSDLLWPHMWSLYSQTVNIGANRVYTYNFQLNGTSGPGPSVLVHEMGHSLGAPDFYRYTNTSIHPVYIWDVMSNNLNTPQHMSAYTKFKYMTWIASIPKITSGGTYTLNPLTSSTNNCYRIDSPNSTTEYFVVEFRKLLGFDIGLPSGGLLVYRVNTAVAGNANGPPDELYVYRPGGTTTSDGVFGTGIWSEIGKATFSSNAGRTSINDSTDPSSFLTNGGAGGLSISNVGAIGSTISFNVSFANLAVSKTKLNFGAIAGGSATTGTQSVVITPVSSWTASSAQSWIGISPASGSSTGVTQISVNPTGMAAGSYTGTVSVIDPLAANSPKPITVNLTVYNSGGSSVPTGSFDTPTNGTTGVTGAIPVTGWVADDIEVTRVAILRDNVAGETPGQWAIGDAIFVEGARPDIETALPGYPMNYKAGWGYMMLTNMLPGQGNGTIKLYAYATDKEGNRVLLGTKTITCSNATAVKPFGTIDSPTQGGEASGSAYLNWGWVLTPLPKTVPKNGSTILVYVDGANVGSLGTAPNFYNQYRSDVSGSFPGLNNTGAPGAGGPVGALYLNTTGYANGVHTIQWVATDDQSQADGIGSRYFSILNTGSPAQDASAPSRPVAKAERVMNLPLTFEPLRFRTGFDMSSEAVHLAPDNYGVYHVEMREVDLLEISLAADRPDAWTRKEIGKDLPGRDVQPPAALFKGIEDGRYSGYMVVGDELRPLPIGSTLDSNKGTFSWMPGPGFVGTYNLIFVKEDESGGERRIPVTITIKPKFGKR